MATHYPRQILSRRATERGGRSAQGAVTACRRIPHIYSVAHKTPGTPAALLSPQATPQHRRCARRYHGSTAAHHCRAGRGLPAGIQPQAMLAAFVANWWAADMLPVALLPGAAVLTTSCTSTTSAPHCPSCPQLYNTHTLLLSTNSCPTLCGLMIVTAVKAVTCTTCLHPICLGALVSAQAHARHMPARTLGTCSRPRPCKLSPGHLPHRFLESVQRHSLWHAPLAQTYSTMQT
jgi:hypothetical protein